MYAILDIETTGGKYNEEGITEIAIHKFDGHKVVDKFISLVNPEKEIQPFVVKLTGINNKMLRTAPKFYEVAKRIVEITKDTVLVAHNAQFDYRILRTEFRRLGFDFERKTICTVELSKQLIPGKESYSLGKLVRSLGIPVSDRHRANGDALATVDLFKLLLLKDLDKSIITKTIKDSSLGELSPRQIDIIEQLPSKTGVYYLHNKEGDIIFIGKSNNIKKRVNKHFTSNGEKARKLQKQTRTVTYENTGNELVSLLKEYEELKRNSPKFNSKLRNQLYNYGVFSTKTTEGYIALKIERVLNTTTPVFTHTSLASAHNSLNKIRNEFQLCDKINDISKAKSNCGNYEDNKCLGACINKESIENYNLRAQKAIDSYSLANKNIIIIDKGREIGEKSAVLIQKGHYKGFGFFNLNHQINNIAILESIITPTIGDKNTNHIIETYLRKRKVQQIIELD